MEFEKINFMYHKEKKIYIMRDHNWAFTAWEMSRLDNSIKPGATLVHIDNHLDFCRPSIEYNIIETHKDAIEVGKQLKIDDFIVPAKENGTIGSILLISDDINTANDYKDLYRAYTLNHYQHNLKSKIDLRQNSSSLILDIDLDFFNQNYADYDNNGLLLPDDVIKNELENIKRWFDSDITTVSLSPEHCGGNEHSQKLLELFLHTFEVDFKDFKEIIINS